MSDVFPDSVPEHVATHPIVIPAKHHYARHAHDYHELFLIQMGQYRIQTADLDRIVEVGDVILYPAGVYHEEWVEGDEPLLNWACTFKWGHWGLTAPLICHDAHGKIQETIAKLAWEFRMIMYAPEADSPASRLTLLQTLLTEVRNLAAPEHQRMVEKVKAYVAAHLQDPFSLEDLTALSGLSTSYFVRQYRATTGRTPMDDARQLRLEEARRLLVKTSLPLYAIANQVGVPDVYYLSRLLKDHFGISARKLRETGQEKESHSAGAG